MNPLLEILKDIEQKNPSIRPFKGIDLEGYLINMASGGYIKFKADVFNIILKENGGAINCFDITDKGKHKLKSLLEG